jgi:hypothetical protein
MSETAAAPAAPKSTARRDRLAANEKKVQEKWVRENVYNFRCLSCCGKASHQIVPSVQSITTSVCAVFAVSQDEGVTAHISWLLDDRKLFVSLVLYRQELDHILSVLLSYSELRAVRGSEGFRHVMVFSSVAVSSCCVTIPNSYRLFL